VCSKELQMKRSASACFGREKKDEEHAKKIITSVQPKKTETKEEHKDVVPSPVETPLSRLDVRLCPRLGRRKTIRKRGRWVSCLRMKDRQRRNWRLPKRPGSDWATRSQISMSSRRQGLSPSLFPSNWA